MSRPISSSSGSTPERSRPSSGQWRISSSYWFWHSGQVRDTVLPAKKPPPDRRRFHPIPARVESSDLRRTPQQLTLRKPVLSRGDPVVRNSRDPVEFTA